MIALWFARDYLIGIWCVLYVALAIGLGLVCLRKRHILWFVLGFFLPLLWLVGAILPDRRVRDRREDRP